MKPQQVKYEQFVSYRQHISKDSNEFYALKYAQSVPKKGLIAVLIADKNLFKNLINSNIQKSYWLLNCSNIFCD